ncbi:hypothetical protein D3C76_218360 [compost metagenome]
MGLHPAQAVIDVGQCRRRREAGIEQLGHPPRKVVLIRCNFTCCVSVRRQVSTAVIGVLDGASAIADLADAGATVGEGQDTTLAVLRADQVVAGIGELDLHAAGIVEAHDLAGGVVDLLGAVELFIDIAAVAVAGQLHGLAGRRVVGAIRELDEDFAVQALADDHGVVDELLAEPALGDGGDHQLVGRRGGIEEQVVGSPHFHQGVHGVQRGVFTHALKTIRPHTGTTAEAMGPSLA